MPSKKFLVGPYGTGLENDQEPWLLPEDAFIRLDNGYVWRNRVRMRPGTQLVGDTELESRLRILIGTTDGNGDINPTLDPALYGAFAPGMMFSIGTEVFTLTALGTPATLLISESATLATLDTTTGVLTITGAAATTSLFFYPSLPVMGLRPRQTYVPGSTEIVAFDTRFAYKRQAGGWNIISSAIPPASTDRWTGSNSNFFWTLNATDPDGSQSTTRLYVVNYNRADGIRTLPFTSDTWALLVPSINAGGGDVLDSCRCMTVFKNRMVAFNTLETIAAVPLTFVNRIRYSAIGAFTTVANWENVNNGGKLDIPTSEEIITVEFVRDRLLIYCTNSTWELQDTGNPFQPFRLMQVNPTLGCESTFSVVPLGNAAIGVGNVGIHTSDATQVTRIDDKIPNEVYRVHEQNSGVERVYGIRDYYLEMIYWTYPDAVANSTYPTRILTYNYKNNTWSFWEDSVTAFGQFAKSDAITWTEADALYETWENSSVSWNSGALSAVFPRVICGNQEGYTYMLTDSVVFFAPSLYITDMTPGTQTLTIYSHNLKPGMVLYITGCTGNTELNNRVVTVLSITDADNIVIRHKWEDVTPYTGGGNVTVAKTIDILTKQFNPGTPVDAKFRFNYVDFFVRRTSSGEFTVDYMTDTDAVGQVGTSSPNALLGWVPLNDTGTNLYAAGRVSTAANPVNFGDEKTQDHVWVRFWPRVQGQLIQFRFFLSPEQLEDINILRSYWEMDAMLMTLEQMGRIIGA